MTVDRKPVYNDGVTANSWALNSAVECHLHTVEVTGSNPVAPTIVFNKLLGNAAGRPCTIRHIGRFNVSGHGRFLQFRCFSNHLHYLALRTPRIVGEGLRVQSQGRGGIGVAALDTES